MVDINSCHNTERKNQTVTQFNDGKDYNSVEHQGFIWGKQYT